MDTNQRTCCRTGSNLLSSCHGTESNRGFFPPANRYAGLFLSVFICLLLWFLSLPAPGASLELRIAPTFSGEPLQPASLRYQTSAHETFSITRLSFLLSGLALQRADGAWMEISNATAWLDLEQKRSSFRLEQVPTGEFGAVRFSIGLSPTLNHLDITNFPAGHPLNPAVNGLHWSWQGGFIFLALEGLWRNPAGQLDGWAYHLAREPNCTQVTLAARFDLSNEARIELELDLAALLGCSGGRLLSFNRDGSSTHSRDSDPIAASLVSNLPAAFRLRTITSLSPARVAAALPQPLYLPAKFTPFPFKLNAAFPIPTLPRDNPLTVERVELGRTLFSDPLLSLNNRQSCSSCHQPQFGFGDHKTVSTGAEGQAGSRNAMPLFNLAWKKQFFWDGRAPSLREQVLQPIQNPIEMHETLTNAVAKLQQPANRPAIEVGYSALFQKAFGSTNISSEKIALALEAYLLTLTSFDAKFDRVQRGEDTFTAQEQRGFELFSTEYDPRRGQFGADCFHCHGGPLFQSQAFANNGLDDEFSDPGRGKITDKPSDIGKFAVPSLRNLEVTAPYMHDGRFQSLAQVVRHYSTGVKRSATLDPNLAKHPDGGVPLNAADQQALVAFLKTLTDETYRSIIEQQPTPALAPSPLADARP